MATLKTELSIKTELSMSETICRVWTYKLDLKPDQSAEFARILETQRQLYNRALLYREILWETHRQSISAGELKKRLITLATGVEDLSPDAERMDIFAYWRDRRRYNLLVWMREHGDPAPTEAEVEAAKPDRLLSIEQVHEEFARQARESAPYIGRCPRRVNAATIDRLDAAYKGMFTRIKQRSEAPAPPGRPQPRGMRHHRTFGYDFWTGVKENSRLSLEGLRRLGPVQLMEYRPCPENIRTIAFTREPDGWYAGLAVAIEWERPPAPDRPAVGMHIGAVERTVTLSDGAAYSLEPIGERYAARIDVSQKRLSRRRGPDSRKPGQRVSNRWKREQERLAKLHMRAERARDLAQKTLARRIAEHAGAVYHEPVAVKEKVKRPNPRPEPEGADGSFLPNGRERKGQRSRAILDFAPGEFVGRLRQAGEWRSVPVVEVEREPDARPAKNAARAARSILSRARRQ
jgi:transposase